MLSSSSWQIRLLVCPFVIGIREKRSEEKEGRLIVLSGAAMNIPLFLVTIGLVKGQKFDRIIDEVRAVSHSMPLIFAKRSRS